MKTDGVTQEWARRSASYVLAYVGLFLVIVSISMPMMNADVKNFWFSMPVFFYLLPMPVVTAGLFVQIWRDLRGASEYRPFLLSLLVFLMGYIGLVVSLWPWMVPFSVTFRQAAAAGPSQLLLLVGAVICYRWCWPTPPSATISFGERPPMKALTEKRRQWLWFAGLWLGGLLATILLAWLVRWIVKIP